MRRFSPPRDPRLARGPARQEYDRPDRTNRFDYYEPRPRSPTVSRSSRIASPGSWRRLSTSTTAIPEKRKRSSPPPDRSPPRPPAWKATTATADHIGRYVDQLATSIGLLSKQEIDLETKKEVDHKHQSEGEKLRRAGGTFISLDERQVENTRKLKLHATRLNQKLVEHQGVKEMAVQSIATSLLDASQGGLPVNREENEKRIRAVEKELTLSKQHRDEAQASLHLVQTEMKAMNRSFMDVQNRLGQLGNLQTGSRDLKNRLSNVERKVGDIRLPQDPQTEIIALSTRLDKTEQETANIGGLNAKISGLDADLKDIQEQLQQSSKGAKEDSLAVELEGVKAEGTKLKDRVIEQEKLVSSLKEVVFEDTTGLVDVVSNADRNVDDFREKIKDYSRDLDDFQMDLSSHNTRLSTLESHYTVSTAPHSAHPSFSQSDHSTRVNQLEGQISVVQRDMTQLTTDQEAKDGMIADENETLHNEINKLKTDYANLYNAQDKLANEVKSLRDILGSKGAVGVSMQRSANDEEVMKRRVSQATQTTGPIARDVRFQKAYDGFQKLVDAVDTLGKHVEGQTDKMAVLENKQQAVQHFTVNLNQEVGALLTNVDANTSKVETNAAKVDEMKSSINTFSTDVVTLVNDLKIQVQELSSKIDAMTDTGGVPLPSPATTDIDKITKKVEALNEVVEVMKGHKTVNLKKMQETVTELHNFVHTFFHEVEKRHLADIYQKIFELCLHLDWPIIGDTRGKPFVINDKEESDVEFFHFSKEAGPESRDA